MCAFDPEMNGAVAHKVSPPLPTELDGLTADQLLSFIFAFVHSDCEELFRFAFRCAGQLTMRDQMEAQSNPARSADAERALALLTSEQRRKLGVYLE